MSRVDVVMECPVFDSFNVQKVAGMFDVPIAKRSRESLSVELPELTEAWQVGVIVGPSGSGKSSVARKAFGRSLYGGQEWPGDRAVIDCFGELEVKELALTLTAVGFSSPPAWVKPYAVLSNGEKFRCDLARALLEDNSLCVFDEFTSVVDRTVAKTGAMAVAKAIRTDKIRKRFVAVTCHYDVVEWLEPDWVLDMATRTLERRRLRRPQLEIEIVRCTVAAWSLFKKHHYLTANINPSAVCFLALVDGKPAGFDAWLPFVGKLKTKRKARRGHRTVVLPDYQGVGIGGRMFNSNASLWAGLGYRVFSCTAHPAEIRSRLASGLWKMTRPPGRTAKDTAKLGTRTGMAQARASNRLTASFEWIGPAMDGFEASRCLSS